MFLKKSVVFAATAMVAVLLAPCVCQAGLFDCLSGSSSTAAPLTYAPPYQAQRVAYMPTCDPCNPCAAPQVNYVPETKYRWKYSRIERTEYQPVASADPCTGCPVTSYRPVTKKSLLPWLHREAYTTYKAVPYGGFAPVSYMQPTYQSGCCDPCSSCTSCDSACGVPSLTSGGCSTCATGSTTTYSESSPSDPGYSGQTYRSEREWTPVESESHRTLKPESDPETEKSASDVTNQPTSMPRMQIPKFPTDRTASVSRVRTVVFEEEVAKEQPKKDLFEHAKRVISAPLVPIE